MKKHVNSAISKLILASLFLVAVATSVQANKLTPVNKNGEVKYVGVTEDNVVFNVVYDNPTGSKFSVILVDQDGTQLYQETYTDKKFDKKFKLPKSEKNKVTFIVRNFKDADIKQSFEVDTKMLESVVVTKVN